MLVVAASPVAARSLRDQIPDAARAIGIDGGGAFDSLGDAIADTAARNLPVVSASAGFTYRYNPALEVFERSTDTLGPIFLERPETLGRGKININVSYQYVELNQYDGRDMDRLEAADPIIVRVFDVGGTLIRRDALRLRYRLNLVNHIVGLSATYGILDNLDANIFVPLIQSSFDSTAERQLVASETLGGSFSPAPPPNPVRTGTVDGDAFGIGDILLRAKYQLPRLADFREALGLQLRLPSGDENDFHGTGTFEASPSYYISTVIAERVEPHANFGVDLRSDDVSRSQGRYDAGVDVDITHRVGVSLAFLGRSQFKGSADQSETEFLHLTPNGPQLRPLLGLDFGRKDYFDLSFGARAVIWRELMLFVNGIYALNDDGLRNDTIIPTVGLEGTF
jgi:hypothetical protein